MAGQILIATNNRHKAKEIGMILSDFAGAEFITVDRLPEQPPKPDETGSTFEENAVIKALYYTRFFGGLCIADDSGLEVEALGGAPGVYSSRYSGKEGDDAANNSRLLDELRHELNRRARFVCVCAAASGGKVVALAHGECRGRLLSEPEGEAGFGYDPLFVPDGFSVTFAQMDELKKNSISHRRMAFEKLGAKLRSAAG